MNIDFLGNQIRPAQLHLIVGRTCAQSTGVQTGKTCTAAQLIFAQVPNRFRAPLINGTER
jgi:hypothetical protein